MSGELWIMARNGTTLLPSEVRKLAADYDLLREKYDAAMAHLDDAERRAIHLAEQLSMLLGRQGGL